MEDEKWISWREFCARLPWTQGTTDRLLREGKLVVEFVQPAGAGGWKYVRASEVAKAVASGVVSGAEKGHRD